MSGQSGFGSSFRSSLSWNMLNFGFGQILQLGIFLLLTTRLSTSVFGVFALALVFIEFFNLEGRFSIVDTLVQKKRTDKVSYSTVYWTSTAMFGVMAAIFMLLAPLAANAIDSPELTEVLRVLALTLLILPLMFGPLAQLNIDMDFKALAIRGIAARIVGGGAALYVAFGPNPEWALVAQRLTATSIEAIFLIAQTRIFPTFHFDFKWAKEFLSEASRIFMAQTCVKSLLRVLDVMIATFFGAGAVGIWRVADRIMQAAFSAFANPMSALWVIMLSAKDATPADKKRLFLNLTQLAATLLAPVFIGLALISQDFVDAMIDPDYAAVGPVLATLAIFTSLSPFYYFRNAALIALKRTSTLVKLAGLDLILLTILAYALRSNGVTGMILALGLVYILSVFLFLPIILKETGASFAALSARVMPAYLGAGMMALAVLGVDQVLMEMPALAEMFVKVGVGAAVFAGYLFVVHRGWLMKTVALVMDRNAAISPAE